MRLLDKIFIYFSLATFVAGEPYLAPNDPFIRHETRLLSDEGKLSGLQNTWPLDLGGIAGMNSGSSYQLPHNLLGNKISEESDSGWSNFSTFWDLQMTVLLLADLALSPVPFLSRMDRFPG